MRGVLLWVLCAVLTVPSLAQEIESSWRQFETELVLVTSSSPDFVDHVDPEFLELLGASTAEAREERTEVLKKRGATLMPVPKVVTVDGFAASMSIGEDVGYFEPSGDGHFEPKSTFVGVTFNFTIYSQTDSTVIVDSELRFLFMDGRMSLSATKLDVGPPILRSREFDSQPSCPLGRWVSIGVGTMQRSDDSGDQVNEQLFAFIRVTENRISAKEKEQIRARYQAAGRQRGVGQ